VHSAQQLKMLGVLQGTVNLQVCMLCEWYDGGCAVVRWAGLDPLSGSFWTYDL
jgi:hypothetical protein